MRFDIVIVGGGQGGASAAVLFRQQGFTGSIAIVGREEEAPYERPPLSKEYMLGQKSFDRLLIRPTAYWNEQNIELLLGCEAVSVNPEGRSITLKDGRTIRYVDLIWAAGGDPRPMNCQGSDLQGIHAVRDRADIDAILAELPIVDRVAIVGGGYIGLEAAAALRALGKEVTLLEVLPRVLARVAGPQLSDFFEQEHRSQGVDLRTGTGVSAFEGDGRLEGLRLTDESFVSAQMAIIGIGISPAVGPLLAAGADGSNGVKVDDFCQTSLPHVYAIGDCAAHANAFADGSVIRVESVQNANDQASCAVKAIMGDPKPYAATPWFWSNQYDLRLQTAGISSAHDQTVLRGDPFKRSFSVAYLKEGRLIAIDCVNNVKDYVQGRKLIENRARIAADMLADSTRPLKDLSPTA